MSPRRGRSPGTAHEPLHFAAYLHALKWSSVTASDARLFQALFRASIHLLDHQLVPLTRALALHEPSSFTAKQALPLLPSVPSPGSSHQVRRATRGPELELFEPKCAQLQRKSGWKQWSANEARERADGHPLASPAIAGGAPAGPLAPFHTR